ncbi:chemotaxis protein MotC [Microvirga pakistanensis]|uniref:chemotaxis protein MotC n=1 Tax=Microvirga pakistanensis TaxID=1682650 RepID=UPI00106B65FF|nr:chemotaxis protein MotC [Microvirga pakistanensis]
MNCLRHAALAMILFGLSEAAIAEDKHQTEAAPLAEPAQTQPETASKPVQMVRTLQLMQDQIAIGSTEAHLGQRGLLTILDARFMDLEPEIWLTGKNVQAAIAFVLSGGNPQILRKLLEMGNPPLPLEHRSFVEGTLAYVEGREEEAKSKLMSLDLEALPPMLSAQLALVQSALLVRTDATKSSELLDFVRLQAPGTLLEEGALRRQVFVASQTEDMTKFLALTSNYLRRYRHSVYAGNFRQRLASALTRIDFGRDPALFKGVVEVLNDLEPEVRRELYLLAARSSVEHGYTKSAQLLAEKAQELSGGDTASAIRAKLYRAAAMIVSIETIGTAVADLESIDASSLRDGDLVLLRSALAMAGHIRQAPGARMAESENKQPLKSTQAVATVAQDVPKQAPEQLKVLSKTRDTLNRIDKLIKNQASTVQ